MSRPRRTAPPPVLAAVLVAVLVAAGCGAGGGAGGEASPAPLVAVTSTSVWGSVARAVAGDALAVAPMVTSPTADPHSYVSTPQDTSLIGRADLVLLNGGGYDEWLAELLEPRPDTPVVEAYDLLDGGGDEHVWYDLPTVAAVADELAVRFGDLLPERAPEFTANAEAFRTELDAVAEQVDGVAQAHAGDRVVLTEPVAAHLVEAAGLVDATPAGFVDAVAARVDPPPAVVAEVDRLVTGGGGAVLVHNVQTGTPATGRLRDAALAAGRPVVDVSETLPTGVEYAEWMTAQVDALAAALDTAALDTAALDTAALDTAALGTAALGTAALGTAAADTTG